MNGNPAVSGIITNFSIAEEMLSSMAAACLTERKRLLDKSIKPVYKICCAFPDVQRVSSTDS